MSTGATGEAGEHVLAVDIGGTKMAAAIVTGDGTILDRRQRPTVGHDSGDEMFAGLVEVLQQLAWRADAGRGRRCREWRTDDCRW